MLNAPEGIDDYFIPFGGIEMATIVFDETVYIKLRKRINYESNDRAEFFRYAIAACLGRPFVIEYADEVWVEAMKLSAFLFDIEGVTI